MMSSRLGDCFLKRMGKTAGTTVTPLSPSKLINQGDFGAFRGRSCCCCWGRSGAVLVQYWCSMLLVALFIQPGLFVSMLFLYFLFCLTVGLLQCLTLWLILLEIVFQRFDFNIKVYLLLDG